MTSQKRRGPSREGASAANELTSVSIASVPNGCKTIYREILRCRESVKDSEESQEKDRVNAAINFLLLVSIGRIDRYSQSQYIERRKMAKKLRELRKVAKSDPSVARKLSEFLTASRSCWKIVRARRNANSASKPAHPEQAD